MKVVGVDPGYHIGLVLFANRIFIEGCEAHGLDELRTTLDRWRPDQIVMEDFRGGHGHVNQRDPLRVIGAVEMWATERDIDVRLQGAGILRTYLSSADRVHPSRHVRCAAAHVRYYLGRSAN